MRLNAGSAVLRHFDSTVSAVCHSMLIERCSHNPLIDSSTADDAARFVLAQWSRMPDPFRTPFVVVSLALSVSSVLRHGRGFNRLSHAVRWKQLERWRAANIGVCRDFVRFVESFVILYWHSHSFPVDRSRVQGSCTR